MAEEISWEIRETAQDLYVTEGKTYEQVAELTGVSVSQLRRWGQMEDWSGQKKEYRSAWASIKQDTVKLRAGLLKKALGNLEPQSVYAFTSIESIAARNKPAASEPAAPVQKIKSITTPEEAIDALQEVVELRLNALLNQPETLQLSKIKELKQSMELIDQMRSKYKPDTDADNAAGGGLSDEMVDQINARILGIHP